MLAHEMMEKEPERQKLRPFYRGFFIFLSIAGMIAVLVSFGEQSTPWRFWISGSVMSVLFGYLGFTGRTPKWLQDRKRR